MNEPTHNQVQAWVDGELSGPEAGHVAQLAATNPQVRALADNLRSWSALIRAHEPQPPLPVTGDFFWSGIRRAIQSAPDGQPLNRAASPVAQELPRPPLAAWLAWLIPAGACAFAALTLLRPPSAGVEPAVSRRDQPPMLAGHQIETRPTGMTSLTFYSAEDAMTVVWLGRVDIF